MLMSSPTADSLLGSGDTDAQHDAAAVAGDFHTNPLAFLKDSAAPSSSSASSSPHLSSSPHRIASPSRTTKSIAADHSHAHAAPATSLSLGAQNAAFVPAKRLGPNVIVLRGVSKKYKLAGREEEVVALRSIDLTPISEMYDSAASSAASGSSLASEHIGPIREGEFCMIRGPSGGGKTTLLNLLGTIDEPTSGTIEMFGERVDSTSSDSFLAALRLNKIGFVFQTFNLLATMSAYENVQLPMIMKGTLSEAEIKHRAFQLLDSVGLNDRYGHLPSELSGGEQQRVTIARALANEPQLLLLDEPTGDLDSRNTVDIMNLIYSLNISRNLTIVMVTHNPDLECYADRILYFEDGRIKKQAVNRKQRKIDYEKYVQYLNARH